MAPAPDWTAMFALSVAPLELFVRGSLIYLTLFLLFRFVVHRDVGGLGLSDLLVLIIIADAAQNAMAGNYRSITDGLVLIATLVGWSALLDFLSFHFRLFRRFALPRPVCLIRDGVVQAQALRRETISPEELAEMLREHEIDDIGCVRRAYLEPDGQMTVLRRRQSAAGDHAAHAPAPPPRH